MSFVRPALAGMTWPAIDIVGASAGPTVAVMAGVHPNEVAAIDAVLRLGDEIDPARLRGRVLLLPVANQPGYRPRTEYLVPIDGKNLNFCFPGRDDGSFSEVLAAALLDEWAAPAECLIDLHGGDLREEIGRFAVCQLTGDAGFDARQLELAHSFGARFLVRLGREHLERAGRSVTGRAIRRQHAVFAEGGSHGRLVEADVRYHLNGILGVLAHHGMYSAPPIPPRAIELTGYQFLTAPVDGWTRSLVTAESAVEAGQVLAELSDLTGRPVAQVRAPVAGYILWRVTHPIVAAGDAIVGLGVP